MASSLRDGRTFQVGLISLLGAFKYFRRPPRLAGLAAAYGYGIARNHPFVDGNKRTSLLAIYTFLGVNDIDFIVPEADAATMILSLAAGEVSEASLARWIRDHWPKA